MSIISDELVSYACNQVTTGIGGITVTLLAIAIGYVKLLSWLLPELISVYMKRLIK